MDLKATTSLIAANAESRIFDALGFSRGFGHGVFTDSTISTNTNTETKELTLKDIEQAVDKLKASDQESQERLIRLMRSIGFNVMVNPHMPSPLIILPEEYEEAMEAVTLIEE